MNVPGRRLKTLTLALVVACAAACVPRGDPPAGRRIVADRVSTPVGFIPSHGDGVTRVLMTRPGQDPSAVDLWVVSVDETGAPPAERLLAQNVVASFDAGPPRVSGQGSCGGTDGRGRLLISINDDSTGAIDLARIDPLTGDRLDLGPVQTCLFSASGQRLLAIQGVSSALYRPDDAVVPLDARIGLFVGEDLYYITTQQDFMRLAADGSSGLLASSITNFGSVISTDTGPALVVTRQTADQMSFQQSVLNLSTGQETPLPFLTNVGYSGYSLSSDGRWFVTFDRTTGASAFVDWRTGDQEPIALPHADPGQVTWRPGHDEAWFFTFSSQQPSLSIRRPGGFAVDLPVLPTVLADDRWFDSIFTADGAWWFSSPFPQGTSGDVLVGSADDPLGPRFQVAPPATVLSVYSLLADGRILVPTWTSSPDRNNLYAVDPRTGDTSVLGEQGLLLAVGQTRLLVNQHVVEHEGDLTVVQLAGGQTVLAPEFTVAAVTQPVGADRVAPGAPLAFSFVARFPSDYDGVWLTTVP